MHWSVFFIFVSKLCLPWSCTVVVKWKMNLLYVTLRPYTTHLPWPDAITTRSIIILKVFNNIENNYNNVAHLHCSEKPYVFYHILLVRVVIILLYFKNYIIRLICEVAVAASWFLLSEMKYWNTSYHLQLCKDNDDVTWSVQLKCYNAMSWIDTYILTPYYSDLIWCAKLTTTRSA